MNFHCTFMWREEVFRITFFYLEHMNFFHNLSQECLLEWPISLYWRGSSLHLMNNKEKGKLRKNNLLWTPSWQRMTATVIIRETKVLIYFHIKEQQKRYNLVMHGLAQNFNINQLTEQTFQQNLHFIHFPHILLAQVILQIWMVDADAGVWVLIGLIRFKSQDGKERET